MNRSTSGSLPTNRELYMLNATCERRADVNYQRMHLERLYKLSAERVPACRCPHLTALPRDVAFAGDLRRQ